MGLNRQALKEVVAFWLFITLLMGYAALIGYLGAAGKDGWTFIAIIPLLAIISYGVYKESCHINKKENV